MMATRLSVLQPDVILSNSSSKVADDKVSIATHYEEFSHLVAVAKRGMLPGQLFDPQGVAIDSHTNKIYVTECIARISIFSENGEFLNTFSHESMVDLWGIAIHRDNVYVTDLSENVVLHFEFSEDIDLVVSQGGEGSGIGKFDGPRGLTVSANGDVFVADCFNNRVQILDSELRYQRQLSHDSMTQPYDVRLTSDEVYILSIKDSSCLHVFSHDGDKIRSLITCGGRGMKVCCPSFLCLDSKENFIISDYNVGQVKVFSKEGGFLCAIGNDGPDDGVGVLFLLNGIAMTKNFNLVVVSFNRKYGLHIFSY